MNNNIMLIYSIHMSLRVRLMNDRYVKLRNGKFASNRLNIRGSGLIHNNAVRMLDSANQHANMRVEPIRHNLNIGKRAGKKNIKLVF